MKDHVSQHHSGCVSKRQLSAFIDQSKRPIKSIQPSDCPFCDDSWARADSSFASSEEDLVVDLDQFRRHLARHLQQVALFALPKLIMDESQSLRLQNDTGFLDQIDNSIGYRWFRHDYGKGWSILSHKRGTFIALASFLKLWQLQSVFRNLNRLEKALKNNKRKGSVEQQLRRRVIDASRQNGRVLEKASFEGYTRVVRLLLEAGVDVSASGGQYRNALHAASSAGRVTTVRLLLDQGADVNAKDGVHPTALQAAISAGHEQTTRLLLDQGAELHTALQAAVSAGHAKTVQLLLDQGADVTAHGEYDGSALQAALCKGDDTTAWLLLDQAANINAQRAFYDDALRDAVFSCNVTTVRRLLDQGANVHGRGNIIDSPLFRALLDDRKKVVQLLIDRGADINDPALEAARRRISKVLKNSVPQRAWLENTKI